jgi:hypothetical protein
MAYWVVVWLSRGMTSVASDTNWMNIEKCNNISNQTYTGRELALLASDVTKQADSSACPVNLWFCAVTIQ